MTELNHCTEVPEAAVWKRKLQVKIFTFDLNSPEIIPASPVPARGGVSIGCKELLKTAPHPLTEF